MTALFPGGLLKIMTHNTSARNLVESDQMTTSKLLKRFQIEPEQVQNSVQVAFMFMGVSAQFQCTGSLRVWFCVMIPDMMSCKDYSYH